MSKTKYIYYMIDAGLHKRVKEFCANKGITIRKFLTSLVKKGLEQNAKHA